MSRLLVWGVPRKNKRAIRERAEQEGLSASDYVRRLIEIDEKTQAIADRFEARRPSR